MTSVELHRLRAFARAAWQARQNSRRKAPSKAQSRRGTRIIPVSKSRVVAYQVGLEAQACASPWGNLPLQRKGGALAHSEHRNRATVVYPYQQGGIKEGWTGRKYRPQTDPGLYNSVTRNGRGFYRLKGEKRVTGARPKTDAQALSQVLAWLCR